VPLSSARQNKESKKGLFNTNKQKTNTRTYNIFVTVSITSLYNGGLKNGNFVVKIYDVKKNHVLLLTVKISKAQRDC
jgi:hypothetical protein